MKRVLVADDHPLFREALKGALTPYFEGLEVVEADTLTAVETILSDDTDFDIILLDLTMPGGEFFNGLIKVKEMCGDIPVAVISATEGIEVVAQVMSLGASGYIPKSSPTSDIAHGVGEIHRGGTWLPERLQSGLSELSEETHQLLKRFRELTPKQIQVLSFVRAGLMNKQIAHEMNVTEATIKAHISAILKKLDINTRTQAVLLMDKLSIS